MLGIIFLNPKALIAVADHRFIIYIVLGKGRSEVFRDNTVFAVGRNNFIEICSFSADIEKHKRGSLRIVIGNSSA